MRCWNTGHVARCDPGSERFTACPSDRDGANLRRMLGRKGEAWGGESGTGRLVMAPAP